MNRVLKGVLLGCSYLFAGKIDAQESVQGNVVIHSDARLAVLVRKNHSYVRLITPEVPRKVVELTPPPPAANTYTASSGLVHHDLKAVYTGKGFRVQIYNGPSREKALEAKTEFMRRFPGVRTYLIYLAPAFRVKIGDYRIRSDAEGMLREANSMFSPSMIVPDMVTISTY
jgi:hypothetical protein